MISKAERVELLWRSMGKAISSPVPTKHNNKEGIKQDKTLKISYSDQTQSPTRSGLNSNPQPRHDTSRKHTYIILTPLNPTCI